MKTDIEKLLSQMTIEEKVGQLQQISANSSEDIVEKFRTAGATGSFLHVLGKEKAAFVAPAEQSKMKILPIFGIDAIHGHSLLKEATIFPSQLAMACSFNEELIEEMGVATGKEVAADGLDWVFSPVLCLGRDLRWGRIDETFGEDAYLASRLGAAIIKGYQKDGMVAACAKHYLGYGEATGGRDSYDTEISERKAREIFLKPFKAAVDVGCMTFMTAYGSIDGEPLTISRRYLTDILKVEYGFDGFIVTDWDNFSQLVYGQKVAEDMESACVQGIVAGNDMCMVSHEFSDAVIHAVKSGILAEEVVDEAARRILRVKDRLGILDGSKVRPDRSVIGCKEHTQLNYRLTVESNVLLKNDGILPLKEKSIAVIGPNAKDIRAQYGDWTYFSHPNEKPNETAKNGAYTLLRGMQEVFFDCEILYAQGCSVDGTEEKSLADERMAEAINVALQADVIVVALGDNLHWNGEMRDIVQPILRGRQIELIKRLASLKKPIIAALINGKPLVLTEIEQECNAIVECFNGGDLGGLAVAKLLKGEENFSGKLPISFPCAVGGEPCYYNQYDYWHGGRYVDVPKGEAYPFGFGLSYSRFVMEEVVLSATEVKKGEKVTLSLKLKNVSEIAGKETVQVYLKDRVCKILTPVRQLIDFKKVALDAGEEKKLCFEIETNEFGYYDRDCIYKVDNGWFDIFVSTDGKEFTQVSLKIKSVR